MTPDPADYRVGITIPLLVAIVIVVAFALGMAYANRTPATPSPTVRTGVIPERILPVSAVTPVAAPAVIGSVTTGVASWYCGAGSPCTRGYPDGMYAAAGPELRVGDWRGSVVTVCAGRCVDVTLIDSCGCPGARIVDLYRSAFARIADPGRGVVGVTVELAGADPTLPPTSTEGATP